LIELQEEVMDFEKKLDDYIASVDKQIEELFNKKYALCDRLVSEAKRQKAIDTDKFILVNKENNLYKIVKE
jgi:hypothetical protein